jgi:hypothetical protein
MSISPRRFVGAFAWALLDEETQARIGAAALELAAATYIKALTDPGEPARQAANAAARTLTDDLLLEFVGLDDTSTLTVEEAGGAWRLPSAAGALCPDCGRPVRQRGEALCEACSRPDLDALLTLMEAGTP